MGITSLVNNKEGNSPLVIEVSFYITFD